MEHQVLVKQIPAASCFLVTGGAGFIGSHLVDHLLEMGHRVVCIDDFNTFYDPAIKRLNIAQHLMNDRYSLVEADIRDMQALERLFGEHQITHVVHLAARAGVRPSIAEPFLYESTNITGTLNLLELCRRFGIQRMTFASSSSVYGINSKVPFSEEDKIEQAISPYAATKTAGEVLCHTYSHLYGIRITCLRFFTVYGARQRPDLAIHKFARLISTGKPIPVFGDGSTKRDYTYIDDIIDGVLRAIAYEERPFNIFNLGESNTVELRYLISLLEEALGQKAVIDWQPLQPGDVPITYADVSRARSQLGYNPSTPIEQGIVKFAAWFKDLNRSLERL